MKTLNASLLAALVAWAWSSGGALDAARASEPHRIGAIAVTPNGRPQLTLAGTNAPAFRNYFDLFRLEHSADLQHWEPLATVVRTNAATNALTFLDEAAADTPLRFYRTAAEAILTPFLPPSGPQAVGTFSRQLTDSTRTNRFGINTNSAFMVTFWYPAQPQPVTLAGLAPYNDRPLALRSAYWGGLTNQVSAFVSPALLNAPLAATPDRFPIVLYSHGLGDREGRAVRTENTRKAVELASHGFVVVSMDHTDTYATVLPSDQLLVGRRAWSFNYAQDRLKDVAFLLDRLAEWNASDPVFQARLDLDQIGIMGWSFGGGTAAEACRLEDRLKAAVLLDPYLASAPVALQKGLGKPYLNMAGSPDSSLFAKATTNAYQLSISGAAHETYTDNAWIVGTGVLPRRRALAMDACMVSFFNKHLQGVDDGLLEDPKTAHPDVVGFRRK